MTAYYNENDSFAAQWLRNLIQSGLIAPGDVDERDIRDVRPMDLKPYDQCHFFAGIGGWSLALRRAAWPDHRPVWTGSCPCQPFSAAGRKGGFADERHLWPAFHHLIDQCRPLTILGEQVASKDGLAWLDLVQSDLEGSGYAVGAVDSCSAGFGAPHIRQRLYWVGHSGRDDVGRLGRSAPGAQDQSEGSGKLARHRRVVPGPAGATGLMVNSTIDGIRPLDGQSDASVRQQIENRGPGFSGLVADAGHEGFQVRSLADDGRRTVRYEGAAVAADVVSGELADANNAEWRPNVAGRHDIIRSSTRRDESDSQFGASGKADRPGPLNGFWRNADWLYCRDGKWRPVESGTFPLAYGDPARVGCLRAYGNAINAAQAEAFIEAVMASIPA